MSFIGVDWGSSSFRAYLISRQGEVLDKVETSQGIFSLDANGFAGVLFDVCGDWLATDPDLPILMSGMVGSRAGWQEMPYVPCPVSIHSLAGRMEPLRHADGAGKTIYLVPGVSHVENLSASDTGAKAMTSADVMRGEEMQIFGALEQLGSQDALICLPGTHSKWVRVRQGEIGEFSTFLSGELFSLLQQHSSVAAVDENSTIEPEAFLTGVDYSKKPGGLLSQLFAPRALLMTSQIEPTAMYSLLSGIVIGNEFAGADGLHPLQQQQDELPVAIVGNNQLGELYQMAASHYGRQTLILDAERAIVAGLFALATANQLIK